MYNDGSLMDDAVTVIGKFCQLIKNISLWVLPSLQVYLPLWNFTCFVEEKIVFFDYSTCILLETMNNKINFLSFEEKLDCIQPLSMYIL